ncbi:MAG: DNA-3-methyladenine glycosylase [Haloferacaceae archaeon]
MSREAYEALRTDAALGPVVERHGPLSPPPPVDLFERLVVSVLRQQVSMAAAAATRDRLVDRVEITPEGILAADRATLRDAGLSRQKARYLHEAAATFRERGWDREQFADRSDAEVIDALTGITGVGEWTARMQLIFSLGRPDVFPVGDLGIRRGMRTLFGEGTTRAEMVEVAERWAPYRSDASRYLWRLDGDGTEGGSGDGAEGDRGP